jgi:hypothetical protein
MSEQQAGWYPDPSGDPSKLRYWDGAQWTDQYQDMPAQPIQAQPIIAQPIIGAQPAPAVTENIYTQAPQQVPYTQAQPVYVQTASTTNGYAIGALICGIIGFCGTIVTSVAAIILGVIGRKQANSQGMATAGLVLGITSLALWVILYGIYGAIILAYLS